MSDCRRGLTYEDILSERCRLRRACDTARELRSDQFAAFQLTPKGLIKAEGRESAPPNNIGTPARRLTWQSYTCRRGVSKRFCSFRKISARLATVKLIAPTLASLSSRVTPSTSALRAGRLSLTRALRSRDHQSFLNGAASTTGPAIGRKSPGRRKSGRI